MTLVGLLPVVDARARTLPALLHRRRALVLPWLNSRFVFLAATAALVIARRQDRSRVMSRLAAFAVVPVASAIAFFLFFQVIYGTPNPSVVYGNVPSMSLSTETLARGVPGLLFDQQFGIIPNAPVFLCAFAGLLVMLWQGPRRLAVELLFIAVPYLLIAASFTSWWGGTTAPARYFVPVALILAVPASIWFATATSMAAHDRPDRALHQPVDDGDHRLGRSRRLRLQLSRWDVARGYWLTPLSISRERFPACFRILPRRF